jgi:site-specific DNA-methyltransferase (adenine-specific)
MAFDLALVGDLRRHQWFTPLWAAERIVERYFADLGPGDAVVEPSCGKGAFLKAIPASIPAVGVELDPGLAAVARAESGRRVLVGDFRTVNLDLRPTAVIGNPPFDAEVVDGILDRAAGLLPEGGRVGFILPAYVFQTPSRVMRYSERWSLFQEMIPRTLFRGMSRPLVFAVFTKDRRRALVGFALYEEAQDVSSMPDGVADELSTGRSPWAAVVAEALREKGGVADLASIYAAVAPRRPTGNQWWKHKVRQTLNRGAFRKVGPSRYALAA